MNEQSQRINSGKEGTMFSKKVICIIAVLLCAGAMLFAQSKGTIVYTLVMDGVKIDPETGEYPDMPHIYLLEDEGYEVIQFYNAALSTASSDALDTLYNANLIIMGRSTPSTDYGDHKQAWNDIPTPTLCLEMWALRSSRLNWFNSTTMVSVTDENIYNALIDEPDDPVFAGIDVSSAVPWIDGPYDAIGVTEAGNGTILARSEDDSSAFFVRFEPDVEFFEGAGDSPAGPRTMIGNGRDNSSAAPFDYYNFTEESEMVFLAEVARLVALGGGGTAVEERANLPSTLVLSQNYPNPFNPTTTIPFDLPERSHIRLSLSNLLGEEIMEIADGVYEAGLHKIQFDGSDLAAGIYFYKIQTENYAAVKKLAVLK
jgi:hypothetical protein